MSGFKNFIMRGNLVELAVAVVIGTQFSSLVKQFVSSFVNPLLSLVGGMPNFGNLTFKVGKAVFSYGQFVTAALSFHVSSRRASRSQAASRVVRRNTNRGHMTGDHHGRMTGRATLLVRAADETLGTHSVRITQGIFASSSSCVHNFASAGEGRSMRSDGGDEAQMWAVLYDDGMSLTTASERIARSLAEAERQRGRRVAVRRLDDAETDPRGVEKPARPPGRARGEGPVRPRGTDKPSVPGPSRTVGSADSVPEPEPIRPAERLARPKPISEPELGPAPESAAAPEPAQALEPTQDVEPPQAAEPPPAPEPSPEPEPPQDREPARPAQQPEPTHAPEPALAVGPVQAVEPVQAAESAWVPEPASETSPPELTREPEPARAATPARRRRLLLYALAAASIVVAAALVDHWGVLPGLGANTSSSTTQVGGPPQRPQLLPPLDQPPVMHFSNAVNATSTPAEPSAQPPSPAAELSGAQNPAARPAGSPASAESPQSATGESSSSGQSTIARGG